MADNADAGPARRTRPAGTIGSGRLALARATLCLALLLSGCGAGGSPAGPAQTTSPTAAPSQSGKDPQVDDLKKCLAGHWTHSHEEDGAQTNVYRPASYAFPPARGRTGYEFHPDGRLTYYGIAAGDGAAEHPGSWSVEGPRTVKITVDGRPEPVVWDISSCDQDKLTIGR